MSKILMSAVFKALTGLPVIVQTPDARRQILDYESAVHGVRIVIDINRRTPAPHANAPKGQVSISVYRYIDLPQAEPVLKCRISTHTAQFGDITDDLYARIMAVVVELTTPQRVLSSEPRLDSGPLAPAPPRDDDYLTLQIDAVLHQLIATCTAQTQASGSKLSQLYVAAASISEQARINTLRVEVVEREALDWAKAGALGWDEHASHLSALFAAPETQPNPINLYQHYLRYDAVYHAYLWLASHLHELVTLPVDVPSAAFTEDLFLR